jgi:hypothetical protein
MEINCSTCYQGYGCINGKCEECPPGTFSFKDKFDRNICQSCLSGKYSPFYGSSVCLNCPPNTLSKEGSSVCTPCSFKSLEDFDLSFRSSSSSKNLHSIRSNGLIGGPPTLVPSYSPTTIPTTEQKSSSAILNNSAIIGISIGGFGFIVVLMFLLLLLHQRSNKKRSKTMTRLDEINMESTSSPINSGTIITNNKDWQRKPTPPETVVASNTALTWEVNPFMSRTTALNINEGDGDWFLREEKIRLSKLELVKQNSVNTSLDSPLIAQKSDETNLSSKSTDSKTSAGSKSDVRTYYLFHLFTHSLEYEILSRTITSMNQQFWSNQLVIEYECIQTLPQFRSEHIYACFLIYTVFNNYFLSS